MIRDIKIKKTNGGFIVRIGCQEFVATDYNKILEGLKDYFEDQNKAEKKYVEVDMKEEAQDMIRRSSPINGVGNASDL
jgi:hypothetical protein